MSAPLFEHVVDGDRQLAIVVRMGGSPSKYNFPTAPEGGLQLGVSFYADGDAVAAHAHHPRRLESAGCDELILVQAGGVEVSIFREDGTPVARFDLGPGEGVLFQQGAHALRTRGDTRLLEVKQGPYVSREKDKYEVKPRREDER